MSAFRFVLGAMLAFWLLMAAIFVAGFTVGFIR